MPKVLAPDMPSGARSAVVVWRMRCPPLWQLRGLPTPRSVEPFRISPRHAEDFKLAAKFLTSYVEFGATPDP